MTHAMQSYLDALKQNRGITLPPIMLRENIQQMKNIERLFESKVRQLQTAVARKDIKKLEECISGLELVIANARELLEQVKLNETNS